MNNLKSLVAAVLLTCVLGLSAFAGETDTPPSPSAPGQTSTPPCSGGQATTDNSATSGIISTPPSTDPGSGYLVTEAAITLFESLLPLY